MHVRAKLARCGWRVGSVGATGQIIEEAPRLVLRRRRAEARTRSLLSIRGERELRNQQQTAPNITQAQIHPAFRVGKYAVCEDPLEQVVGRIRVVAPLDANEREGASVDGADYSLLDLYFSATHALNQRDHGSAQEIAGDCLQRGDSSQGGSFSAEDSRPYAAGNESAL